MHNNILIFGNSNLSKHIQSLSNNHFITCFVNSENVYSFLNNDICLETLLKKHKQSHGKPVIINTVAKTNLQYCEKNFEDCNNINNKFSNLLSNICIKLDIPIFYISTCGVYGDCNTDYTFNKNNSLTIPVNNYGYTKYSGEKSLIEQYTNFPNNNFNKIIRTSWLYDDNLDNPKFISSIYKKILSNTNDDIVVTSQMGCYTYVPKLAEVILKLCNQIFNNCMTDNKLIEIVHDKGILSRFSTAKYIYTYLENKGLLKQNKRIVRLDNYDRKMNVHEVTIETINTGNFEDNIQTVLNSFINQQNKQSS